MSQRVGTAGSAVIGLLSVIVAFRHTARFHRLVRLGYLVGCQEDRVCHRGYMPLELVKHCCHKGGEEGDTKPEQHGWQGKGEVKVR